eukprot:175083_1
MSAMWVTLLCIFQLIDGHMRFLYPVPRSESAGIKVGPCGDDNNDFSGTITTLQPNSVVTVQLQEVIHHVGAPYRFALSHVNSDEYEDCILLDHIPQHARVRRADVLFINITIPDVDCDPCALQALSVMTDKISEGDCCKYEPDGTSGTCFSNYHSCANVRIHGKENRVGLQCEQPIVWPYRNWQQDIYTQETTVTYWRDVPNNDNELQLELLIQSGNENDPCSPMNSTSKYKSY